MTREDQPADRDDVLRVWVDASALERKSIRNVYLPGAETWVWEADGRVVGFISLLGNEIGGLLRGARLRAASRADPRPDGL